MIRAAAILLALTGPALAAGAPPPPPTFTIEEMNVAQQLAAIKAQIRDLDQSAAAILDTPAGRSLKAKVPPPPKQDK